MATKYKDLAQNDIRDMEPVLYTPATLELEKMVPYLNGESKYGDLVRRLVICTEDSVAEGQLKDALKNIKVALREINSDSPTQIFIRLRDHDRTMDKILTFEGIANITGFVIPKAHPTGFPKYAEAIRRVNRGSKGSRQHFYLLPIIEHKKTPDSGFRRDLRMALEEYRQHIDCVRIGGNDLLGHQALRRAENVTIYDTNVGILISNIVNEFRGISEFPVTAPVFESFEARYDLQFRHELARSIANGLFGQTVIHPRHLRMLYESYRVPAEEYASAIEMIGDTPAVVGKNGRMDEVATHGSWAARTVLARVKLFGVQE
jgi:citrate lyase beta subunit